MYADTIWIGTAVSWYVQTAAADISPPRARTGHKICSRNNTFIPSPPMPSLPVKLNIAGCKIECKKTNPPEIGCKLINCILEKTPVNKIETESPMEIR